MTETKKLIPKRRFSGFTEAWEQCKLEDISEIIGGGTPSTSNSDYWDGDIDWYAPAEIDAQIYVIGSKRKITEMGLKNSSAKILPANKTILFTSRAGIGKTAILSRSGATNQGFQSMVLKDEYDSYFIYSMSNQIKDKAEAIASGSTFLEISGKMLAKLEIMVPSKSEQDIVGSFFKSIDNLITLHQRKLDKIKSIKKAYLFEMFPVDGECKPKRRFAGFTEAWEQCKLSELTEYKNGKGHEDKQSTSGKYELVNLNSISIDGGLKHSGKFIDDTTDTLFKNDLVIVLSDVGHGDLLGRVALIPENDHFVLNQRVALLRPNSSADPQFLFSYINAHQRYFKAQGAGMSQLNISKGSVENFTSLIPDKEEQVKIGSHFKKIDNLITLHQRKLDKLQNLKKAYLNEMFI